MLTENKSPSVKTKPVNSVESSSKPGQPRQKRRWLKALLIASSILFLLVFSAGFAGVWYEDNLLLHPSRKPIDHYPTIKYENVQFTTEDNISIKGWYMPAEIPGKAPAIILVHGIGQTRNDFNIDCRPESSEAWRCSTADKAENALNYKNLIQVLHEHGYALLAIDQRAHGESGGDFCSYGLYEERDVAAALKNLQGRADIDSARLGIFGVSMGSMTTIRAAARHPELKAIAVESPFADLNATLDISFARFTHLPSWLSWPVAKLAQVRTGMDITQQRPIADMPALGTRPFYAIGDKQDTLALPGDAKLLYEASQSPQRKLWEVEDAGHVEARKYHREDFDQKLLAFFAEGLR